MAVASICFHGVDQRFRVAPVRDAAMVTLVIGNDAGTAKVLL
jgi:hypothetical protein